MAAWQTQVFGGGFCDIQGNALAGGTLEMTLMRDAASNPARSEIGAGRVISIGLDSSGNVPTSPAVYVAATDKLNPIGNFYKVRVFNAGGQLCFGPQYFTVPYSGGSYNLDLWVPITGLSITAIEPGTPLELETNGTPNISQALLNLYSSDASVTLTDEGSGSVNLQTAPAPVLPTLTWMISDGQTDGLFNPYWNAAGVGVANRVYVIAFDLKATITINNWAMRFDGGSGNFGFGIYDSSGNLKVTTGALSFVGSGVENGIILNNPVTLTPGEYYFAWTADTTSGDSGPSWITIGSSEGIPASAYMGVLNNAGIVTGYAQNPSTSGLLPATLGTLTGAAAETNTIMLVKWN